MAAYPNHRASPAGQYNQDLNMIPLGLQQTDMNPFVDDFTMFGGSDMLDFDATRPVDYTQPNDGSSTHFNNSEHAQSLQHCVILTRPAATAFNDFTNLSPGYHPALSIMGISPLNSLPNSHGGSLASSPANGIIGGLPALQSRPTVPDYSQFEKHFGPDMDAEPRTGDKRNVTAASLPSVQDLDEASRFATEEDKRRRNTAASARFRVKKKQREQALEQSAKAMTDKVSSLQGRIAELEQENKWLKDMLIEKNMTARSSVEAKSVVGAFEVEDVVAANVAAVEPLAVKTSPSDAAVDQIKVLQRKRGIGTVE